jgi:hypothetical protein
MNRVEFLGVLDRKLGRSMIMRKVRTAAHTSGRQPKLIYIRILDKKETAGASAGTGA